MLTAFFSYSSKPLNIAIGLVHVLLLFEILNCNFKFSDLGALDETLLSISLNNSCKRALSVVQLFFERN